jgi:transcriptional regulator with XRE-family HTH domain
VKLPHLRAIRERKPLSQRELAEQAGLSRVAIIKIEAGAADPHPATIRKLATALGVEPTDLMAPNVKTAA